jgi:hypothetical protein
MPFVSQRKKDEQIVLTNRVTGERIIILPMDPYEKRQIAIDADMVWAITRESREARPPA